VRLYALYIHSIGVARIFAAECTLFSPKVFSPPPQHGFWTSDLEWTARRRCFGADIFKFPALP